MIECETVQEMNKMPVIATCATEWGETPTAVLLTSYILTMNASDVDPIVSQCSTYFRSGATAWTSITCVGCFSECN